ncbi:hypothetical protein N7492_010558 [Penicillium capsulatum]|uniref:Cell morphogenesis protein Las1 n=1 Tax=Penicillium capsulatum TaxID=69766 RepID=A0A9W9HNY1_9EURO|nr:hypothetical protein N7492_010558 [Penicillium capsulatum]KAJ6113059.1 hypothetical protein N7512_008383 [Penicillium capsulatum]
MAKVLFTAWKDKSQLLDVRGQFYPSLSDERPDMRSHACAMVEAWKLRGNVPHHVEATALLTDAILHDDALHNSIFSIRATYSAAFCRFVTGLVDSKIHGQRKTMFQRAMDLGLPASFVELRHEATHREPPSLVVLRKAAQRSLEWLWDHYWAGIDDVGEVSAVQHDGPQSLRRALVGTLQQLSTGTGSEPLRKKRKRDFDASVASQLVSICGSSSQGIRALPPVLLEEPILVAPARTLGEPLKEAFDKWDPVLLKITESDSSFLMYLTEELVHALVFDEAHSSSKDAIAEGIYLWLTHLLTSPSWEPHQAACPRSYIHAACEETPNHWANLLKKHLQKRPDSNAGISRVPQATPSRSSKRVSLDGPESNLAQTLRGHGWAPVDKWDSRPLGIASSS